jgi:putative inorganic carbon (HCO3(-)) transporter
MRATRPWGSSPAALVLGALAGWLAAVNVKFALGAVAAAAVAILVFVGAEILLLGVVAVEPFTDALQFPASFPIPKIVGLLAVASWALAAATGRTRLRFTPQMGWGFLFLAVIVLSLMLSPDPSAGVTRTISYALYVLFLGLFVQNIRTRREIERCLGVYAGAVSLAALDGLFRFATGKVHLASGPIGDPNDFALILSGAIPIVVLFAFTPRRGQWLWRVALVVIVACTLATLSRGALVGFAAVLLWALLSRRISMPGVLSGALAVSVVAAVALIFFQPLIQERLVQKSVAANQNAISREVFWKAALSMSIDHPVTGVGPSRFGVVSEHYVHNDPTVLRNPAVHNSYLEILAEDGPFALMLFVAFLISTWRALRAVRRRALDEADARGVRLADTLMASLVWTAVSMSFVSKQLAIPMYLIAGLAGCLTLLPLEATLVRPHAIPIPETASPRTGSA